MKKRICPACKHKMGFRHQKYTKCPNNIARNTPSNLSTSTKKDKLLRRTIVGGCLVFGSTFGFLIGGPPGAIWGGILAVPLSQISLLNYEYEKSKRY